jgi:sulfite reductase alpha subunit-like flavoprotein
MANAQQRPCLVLYGSATGNAEEIARAISEEAPNYGIAARYACLDQFKKGELTPGAVCIFVVSTTGEGEAPENCSRFMRTIKRKSQKPTLFEGISFTCCGLGDTNYTNFCNTGKFVNRRMCELGAEKFYAECEADEGVGGLEQFIEPWKDGLWGPLRIALGMDNAVVAVAPAAAQFVEEADAPAAAATAAVPSGSDEVSGGGGSGDGVAAAAASSCRLSFKDMGGMGSTLEAMGDPSAVARQAVATHIGAALFSAAPTAAHQLTSEGSAKTVWHMQLDVSAVRNTDVAARTLLFVAVAYLPCTKTGIRSPIFAGRTDRAAAAW